LNKKKIEISKKNIYNLIIIIDEVMVKISFLPEKGISLS